MTSEGIEIRQYVQNLSSFFRWENAQVPSARPFSDILADLGFVFSLIPPEDRRNNDDPVYEGIRKMHEALSVLTYTAKS